MTECVSWICPVCGLHARVLGNAPRIFCCCGYQQLNGPTPGLGDYTAAALHKIGITKQRVSRLIGRPCKCPKRQQVLNNLGRKIGIGEA